jgi:protein-disulfide isomerase
MLRPVLVSLFKHSLAALLLLCFGCSAQTAQTTDVPNDVNRNIERHIRAYYQLPEEIQVQTGTRKASEFANYDSLTVTLAAGDKKQEQQFLISKDNKTLVRFSKMDLTKDPYAEVMSKIDLDHRPWRGNKDAKVVIVDYDDFQCPFCTRMHQTLFGDIFKSYADKVKIVYKDFPLYAIHPWANRAAIDSNCLAALSNDAYWSFADYIHANPQEISGNRKPLAEQLEAVDRLTREQGIKFNLDQNKLNACIKTQDDSAVRASVQEAEQVGVQATPTMFINGQKIDGAVPAEQVRAMIERALRDASQSAPSPAR